MGAHARAAGAAYEYAWWLTGSTEAAGPAVRAAHASAGGGELAALLASVRRSLGADSTLEPAAEVALLACRLGLSLPAAATVAGVSSGHAAVLLPRGLLAALPERANLPAGAHDLPALAIGAGPAARHAGDCSPCRQALALFERARSELAGLDPPVGDPGLLELFERRAGPPGLQRAGRPGRQRAGATSRAANRRWWRLAAATGVAVVLALLPARPPAGQPLAEARPAAPAPVSLPLPDLDDLVLDTVAPPRRLRPPT